MILDKLTKSQTSKLYKAFNKAKTESGRELIIRRSAKEFANYFGKIQQKSKFDIERTYEVWERKIRSALAKAHDTKEAYYRHIGKTPPKIEKSYDGILQLMDDLGYKSKDRESIAKELSARGKDFIPLLVEKIKETQKFENETAKQEELDILLKREYEIEKILQPISNFSIQEGEENFKAWENVLWIKLAFINDVLTQLQDESLGKGAIRSSLKDIQNRIADLAPHIMKLIQHLQINSYATRMLSNWYVNNTFDEGLKDEHLRLCLGLAYAQTKGMDEEAIFHSHNSILLKKPNKEIVFRNKYLKNQILYKSENKYVKEIIEIAVKQEKELMKTQKEMWKLLEGKRKLSHLWNKFFVNSIEIADEFLDDHSQAMLEEELAEWQNNWTDLYANLNVQTALTKEWRAKEYRAEKKSKKK